MAEDHWQKDARLIEQWQQGNDEAFREIYKQNFAKVKNSLIQNLGISLELAEEFFDDAMLILHEKRTAFRVEGLVSTYLYKVAKNRAIDYFRKASTRLAQRTIGLEDWLSEDKSGRKEESKPESGEEMLLESSFLLDTEEEDLILSKALKRMEGSTCGKIFSHQYWDGMILKDVAKKLNMNESYIRRKVKECESELKKIIEQLRLKDL